MTLRIIGWVVIGLSACLLGYFSFFDKQVRRYPTRKQRMAQSFLQAQQASLERGLPGQIFLGHRLWSYPYPGLGLHALSVMRACLTPDAGGELAVTTADGALAVMARQVVEQSYQDGYSPFLVPKRSRINVPGPTPLTFTVGFLSDIARKPNGTLALLGNYGPESLLWVEAVQRRGGIVMASAGSLASQAALYAYAGHILIGESGFMLPDLMAPGSNSPASLMTEDILRILLISSLIIGAILKGMGIL